MEKKEIIEKGRLIYQSTPSDTKLRDWPLNSIQIKISYYTLAPLSAIDKLICSLLANSGGQMDKQELGLTLGFDIATTIFKSQSYYKDDAEVEMYNRLLDQLKKWNLITVISSKTDSIEEPTDEDGTEISENAYAPSEIPANELVRITKIGEIALERNTKFSFYCADVIIYTNFFRTGDKAVDNAFPYFKELNIEVNISNSRKEDVNPDEIDLDTKNEWTERILLQLNPNWDGHIYLATPLEKTFPIAHKNLDFKLFEQEGEYHLLVFNDNLYCSNATDIINARNNVGAKRQRIKKCLYYKLINDENAVFSYNEVIVFWDNLEEDEYYLLLKDQRVVWSDELLFKLIVDSEYCSTNTWMIISELCPIDTIKVYIEDYKDNFNWLELSRRMDIDFILDNPDYPWSYSTILDRQDISMEQAQNILLIPSFEASEWDWDLVSKFLTIEFVENDIDNLNINFYQLTSWLPNESLDLIIKHNDKNWNWDRATQLFSLNQIIDNLSLIKKYINLPYLVDRCFSDKDNSDIAIRSEILKDFLKEAVQSGKMESFSLRDKYNYIWTDNTIAFLEDINLLNWKSKYYEKGFAQYPYVQWNAEFFAKYSNRLTEQEDRTYVSYTIEDMDLIKQYPNFQWDWNALSANPNFSQTEAFIRLYADKIEPTSWIQVAEPLLIEENFVFLNLERALNDEDSIIELSNKVSKDFIKSHPTLSWDNKIFTNAFASDIVSDQTLLKRYYSHWDWAELSMNVPASVILNNIELPWSNEYLTKAICSSGYNFSVLINRFVSKIDWNVLSEEINYYNFLKIAETYQDKWDWDIINCRLSSLFTIDLLSNENICEYISWNSVERYVLPSELLKVIVIYPEKFDWSIVTERVCTTVTIETLLDKSIIDRWDWNCLTRCVPVNVLQEGLSYTELPWDWSIVSQRLYPDFILNNLNVYQDKWDWDVIWNKCFTHTFVSDNLSAVAKAINSLDEERSNTQWKSLTRIFNKIELKELSEKLTPNKSYYWDYTYIYEDIKDITKFVSESHSYIDWAALSCSNAADGYFHYDSEIFDARIWKSIAKKRLDDQTFKWDFKSLTQLDSIQKGYQVFFKIKEDIWDWDFISSKGYCLKTENNGEANLRKYKDIINFSLLSKRLDIGLSESMLESYIDEAWDWNALSSNPNIQISIQFVSTHKEKKWDWNAISKNKSIKWDAKTAKSVYAKIFKDEAITSSFDWEYFVSREDIRFDKSFISYIHKYVNNFWPTLTSNKRFIPSVETMEIAKKDCIDLNMLNWDFISQSKFLITFPKKKEETSSPDMTFIKAYASFLNWKLVTQNVMFDIYDDSLLDEFKSFVDWTYISKELDTDKLDINYLSKFKKYLDWNVINQRIDYQVLNEGALECLSDYLDWEKVSKLALPYSKQLLDKFADRWEWSTLLHNDEFNRRCTDEILAPYKKKLNVAEFIDRFSRSSIKIYHFTHLFNVLEVLKTRKILSRNRAVELSKLKFDSAGAVIGRTAKAHPYARFYFRTNTPTQFYNECLGWDSEMTISYGNTVKSYYPQALNLGLPKCPIPIFLEFDLKEVLSKMSDKCFYSDGNLQTNWASIYKVNECPSNMRMEYLYNSMNDAYSITIQKYGWEPSLFRSILTQIREQSQQEFLIKGEFDFSNIQSLRIHCYDENTARMLREYLNNDPIIEHIVVGGCFLYRNRDLQFDFDDDNKTISISSDYEGHGDAYFLIKGEVDIVNTEDIKRQVSDGIIVYPMVKFRTNSNPCEIYFIDKRARTTDWLIYSNVLSNMGKQIKIDVSNWMRHVIMSFEKDLSNIAIPLSKALFYPHMLNSYHGIAHTSRVLFATHMILERIGNIDDSIRKACYIAAIIHDIGKQNDIEGSIHGYKSAARSQREFPDIFDDPLTKERILNAVQYHSVNDNETPDYIKEDVIWNVLKDSDALDRSRFSGRGCDKNYLRLSIYDDQKGQEILKLSQLLPGWTSNNLWDNPCKEIVDILNKYMSI